MRRPRIDDGFSDNEMIIILTCHHEELKLRLLSFSWFPNRSDDHATSIIQNDDIKNCVECTYISETMDVGE
jgi:hypothetical protein